MKLTERYELLELVSSGRVSTFIARERNTQEQVVVHTFECPGANLPASTAAILIRFGALAPNPPGDVLKAGLDDASSSAFIVTKMPTQAALQEWVRTYRFFPETKNAATTHDPVLDATAEISADKVRSILAQGGSAKPQPPAANSFPVPKAPFSIPETPPVPSPAPPSQSAGEFTRMFRDLGAFQPIGNAKVGEDAGLDSSSNSIPTGMFEIPALREQSPTPSSGSQPGKEAGDFTKQFFAPSKSGAKDPAVPPGSKPEAKQPGPFTQEFSLPAGFARPDASSSSAKTPPKNVSPSSPVFDPIPNSRFEPMISQQVPEQKDSATQFGSGPEQSSSGGEFTSFFRGPFDQPGASSKPIVVPDQVPANPRQQAGDFTQMFGKGTDFDPDDYRGAKPSEPSAQPPANSFTQIFGPSDLPGKIGSSSRIESELPSSTSSMFGSTSSSQDNAAFPPRSTPIASPIQPPPPAPVSPPEPVFDSFAPPKPVNAPSRAVENAFGNRPGNNDATDVFRVPSAYEPPVVNNAPSGPSEFTTFLNRSQVNAALSQSPAPIPRASAPVPPPTPSPFSFTPPPAPAPPAMQFPPAPAPAAPVLPKPPQFAMPQPPAAPKLKAPAAAPNSFWPLVTVLSILIFIGILLVMYFALKH